MNDDKLIIVGQAPGSNGSPDRPLEGRSARKLAALAGVSEPEFLSKTERVNVLGRFPGKSGKGDKFPMSEARKAASDLALSFRGRSVILLGGGVRRAFRFPGNRLFEWETVSAGGSEFLAAVVPHPSGVNRWWNEKSNRMMAGRFMRSVMANRKGTAG
jgi:uracil-DNA glycosylase